MRTLHEHLKAVRTESSDIGNYLSLSLSLSSFFLSLSSQLEQHSNHNEETCKMKKIAAIKERLDQLEASLSTLKTELETEREKVREIQDKAIGQWMLELQSAGNVRYIHGSDEYTWYKPCVELVMSRFIATGATVSHCKM